MNFIGGSGDINQVSGPAYFQSNNVQSGQNHVATEGSNPDEHRNAKRPYNNSENTDRSHDDELGEITQIMRNNNAWELVDYIKKSKIDVNKQYDEHTGTLLHLAVSLEMKNDRMGALIALGADPYLENSDGKTPLDIAKKGTKDRIKKIFHDWEQTDILIKMITSSDSQNIEKIKEFFKENTAYLEMLMSGEMTALHHAALSGNKEIVDILLKHGFNVNKTDYNRQTALHHAVILRNKGMIDTLLEHKADPNIQDYEGKTALHYAALSENNEMADALLKHEADQNIQDCEGKTALHHAALSGNEKIADTLLVHNKKIADTFLAHPDNLPIRDIANYFEHGANPNIRDNDGKTALHYAVLSENKKIADNLLVHHEEMVGTFLADHDDLNTQDNDGKTALHYAVLSENKKITGTLLAHHAALNIKDNNGKTPLDYTTKIGMRKQ